MAIKILVCGGRSYTDHYAFHEAMVSAIDRRTPFIIQGGASGADLLAKQWAEKYQVHCAEVPARWDKYGKAAGPIRNSMMLGLNPDLVLAFPGGAGTADMVKKAKAAGIPVIEV